MDYSCTALVCGSSAGAVLRTMALQTVRFGRVKLASSSSPACALGAAGLTTSFARNQHDLVIIGGGPGGEGRLAVLTVVSHMSVPRRIRRGRQGSAARFEGCMRRDAGDSRWDLPQCRLHPVEGVVAEFAPLPHGQARLRGARPPLPSPPPIAFREHICRCVLSAGSRH